MNIIETLTALAGIFWFVLAVLTLMIPFILYATKENTRKMKNTLEDILKLMEAYYDER